MNREDWIIVFLAGWTMLAILFLGEGLYYAGRWVRDRWRWLKFFSWQ